VQVHLRTSIPEALALGLMVAFGALLASRTGPSFERAVFLSAATRVWKSALEAPRSWQHSLPARVLFVVASGPFKAPFGASIALLTLSHRVSPAAATLLLAVLYVLRCASTGQTHTERSLALLWRSQHGGGALRSADLPPLAERSGAFNAPPSSPFQVPTLVLHRLAAKSHEALGRFEREDVRAYLAIAAVLHVIRGGLPPALMQGMLLTAVALPVWMLADARRAIVDSAPSNKVTSERTVRRFFFSFVAAVALCLAAPPQWHFFPFFLTTASVGLVFAATAFELLAFALGFGAPHGSKSKMRTGPSSADGNMLVVNPASLRKVRYRRDIGISRAAERGAPLLRYMRLRAWFESFSFAQTMRASARADLLLTSVVVAGWLL
jgi:hypothetical protein